MAKRVRKSISFRREANRKQVIPIILFVDGDTEIDYFHRINNIQRYPYLSLKPIKGNFDSFQREREKIDAKNAYLILDIDDHGANENDPNYAKLKSVIEANSETVFFSNYAFETWLLLHKIKNPPYALNGNEMNKKIETRFKLDSSWRKTQQQRDIVMSQIDNESISAAIHRNQSISKEWTMNPSTNLCELFSKLIELDPDFPTKTEE